MGRIRLVLVFALVFAVAPKMRGSGKRRKRISGPLRQVGVGRLIVFLGIAFVGRPLHPRNGRRVVVSLRRAPIVPAVLARRITLPDQPSELRERIVGCIPHCGIGVAARHGTTISKGTVSVIGHLTRLDLGFTRYRSARPFDNNCSFHAAEKGIHRISFGASTPSNASPEASTVKTPCTRTRRATVICRSFWIMKRKCGEVLPSVQSA